MTKIIHGLLAFSLSEIYILISLNNIWKTNYLCLYLPRKPKTEYNEKTNLLSPPILDWAVDLSNKAAYTPVISMS